MSTPPAVLRERLADHLLQLLRIPSVIGNEKAIADHMEAWGKSRPAFAQNGIVRHGNNLIFGTPDPKRQTFGLVGHLDTVPFHDGDGPAERDGDRIIGLGASDMKGSIAVMQVLLENHDPTELPFNVMMVLYDREEGPYDENGLGPLLDNYDSLKQIDLALCMEPTDNTLQLGCVGGLQATVTFHGKRAHSARPWQGDNAIHKAGAFLSALAARPFDEVEIQGLVFRDAMSATLAKGGHARNVVPDRFELNVNYRFPPVPPVTETVNNAVAHLNELASGAEIHIHDIAPPGPVPEDSPLLEHFKSKAQVPVHPKQAWTDVARLAAAGIDAANFGPGMTAQAHQAGEWISLEAMLASYEALERVLTARPVD